LESIEIAIPYGFHHVYFLVTCVCSVLVFFFRNLVYF